jgi:hypothetical protein
MELVKDASNERFDKPERDRLLRGFLPEPLLEAGLIARPDDRGDSVLQIAPPLICDAAVLDEIVERLHDVLAHAGRSWVWPRQRRWPERVGPPVASRGACKPLQTRSPQRSSSRAE